MTIKGRKWLTRGLSSILVAAMTVGSWGPAARAYAEEIETETALVAGETETDSAAEETGDTEPEGDISGESAYNTEEIPYTEESTEISGESAAEKNPEDPGSSAEASGEETAPETPGDTEPSEAVPETSAEESLPAESLSAESVPALTEDGALLEEMELSEIVTEGLTLYVKGSYRTATIVNTSTLNIRADATTDSTRLGTLYSGTMVTVYGEKKAADGTVWYLISNGSIMGYCSGAYLQVVTKAYDTEAEFEEAIKAFPSSYRDSLRALHHQYPNWKFEPYNTGIKWSDAVAEEYKFGDALSNNGTAARSLVDKNSIASWKSTDEGAYDWETGTWVTNWDGSSWAIASKALVAYYMDPRNFLDSNGIFQFLDLSYDATQDASAVQEAALGMGSTWLSKTGFEHRNGDIVNYPKLIATAGRDNNINAIALTAIMTQELGTNGDTKKTISGMESWTVSESVFNSVYKNYCPAYTNNGDGTVTVNYTGLYNYFNIGAYTTTGFTSPYQRGLWIAQHKTLNGVDYGGPWNTREKAIRGGAKYFSLYTTNYGQNTIYLKRFNVTPKSTYNHQFSTDIQGAASEGRLMGRAYTEDLRKKTNMTFYIPVYDNMPSSRCPMPMGDLDPNDQVKAFVTRLYEKILGRTPDDAGLNDWVGKLKRKEQTASRVAYGFVFSQEYQKKKTSDKSYVTMLYNTMLSRNPDSAGLADWTGKLADGLTRYYVFSGFVGSQEFRKLCESYGIEVGSYTSDQIEDKNPGVTAFVTRMYTVCLGRSADDAGRKDWISQLLSGKSTASTVVKGFFLSPEFKKKNLSDSAFLDRLYLTIFDRKADAAGKAGWAKKLASGTSRESVINGFLGSQEFIRLCEKYGVKR